MAKKKGGKKGGKKKKDDSGEDGAEMNPLQIAMMFQAENVALQRKLALRTEEADRALQARKAMGSKVAEMKQQWSDKEEEKSELTTNMTREYKRMQDELLNRVNILENISRAERSAGNFEQKLPERQTKRIRLLQTKMQK